MSVIDNPTTTKSYEVSLEAVKSLIAADLNVPAAQVHVDYVIGDVGPGDPLDRFPAPRGVVKLKVTVTG